jgi:predicted ester cyclase
MNHTETEQTQLVRSTRERIVREHMEDENTRHFERVLGTFPHPHYEIIPSGRVLDGTEAVNGYYLSSRRMFPDQRNELISLRHADDAVIVEFWLRGTHSGKDSGVKPTGASFETRMTAFFIFEGTVLKCERVYFDAMGIARQLMGKPSPWKPGSWLRALRVLKLLRQQTA